MRNKFLKNLGATFFGLALSSASLTSMGASNSYYRTRRGGYSGNKQYLADPGLTPFTSISFQDVQKTTGSVGGMDAETDVDFHFEKGQKIKELLIVDGAVQNKSVFLSQARPGVDVIEIESGKSGIVQLLATLTKYRNLEAVHVISHAKSGSLQLGNDVIDAKTFEENVSALAALNGAIKSGGDLLFYGCELAKGAEGERFLEVVKGNYDFDIAASNDLTGNDAAKADWDLEIQTGDIEATPLPESIALKDFTGELQFSGTINFQEIKTAGDYTSFGGTKSDTEFYTSASNEYTLYTSGTYYGTGTFNNSLYSGNYGGTITMNFDGGATFNATSIYLKRFNAGSANFNISSNLGAIVNNQSVSNTGTTVALSTNNVGITHLYVSYAAGDVAGGAFYIDDLVVASVSAGGGDTTPPEVTSIARQSPTDATTNATSATFRVTFDEDVSNVSTDGSDFAISGAGSGGTATITGASAVTGSTVYDVVVGSINTDGLLDLGFAGGQDIQDAASNAFALTITSEETYTIDQTGASTTTPDLNTFSDSGSETFTSGASTDNRTSDLTPTFTGATEIGASVIVTSSVAGSLGSAVVDGSGNWSLTPSSDLATGAHTITAQATDALGNTGAVSGGLTINIDNTGPTVMISSTSTDPSNDNPIPITITFSEEVENFDENEIVVNGTANATTGDFASADSTTFTVNLTPGNDGTILVDVNGGAAPDLALNNNSAATQFSTNYDGTAPTISSSTPTDNATGVAVADDITITFNEDIQFGAGFFQVKQSSDDAPIFSINASTPTATTNKASISGATLTINPGASLAAETGYYVFILSGTPILDLAGNPFSGLNNGTDLNFTTVDVTAPAINSVTLDASNGFIDVTFSEGVYNTNAGSGVLEASDFSLSLTGGTATSPSVTTVTTTGGAGLSGGETTIRVNFTVTGIADGSETLEVDITDGTSIFDAAGNGAAANQTANNTATLNDAIVPVINSVSLDGSNGFIDVTLSEGVYNTNAGSGAVESSDFSLSITGGAATSPTVTTVTTTGGAGLSGGETTIRVNFSVTGSANGSETLEVDITDGSSIFDAVGNAAVANQTSNNTATLNDVAGPAISSVSLDGSNGFIDVTFNEGAFNTGGGSGAVESSDFSLSLTGGTATSPTVTTVTTTGGAGLSGGETTIRLNFTVTGTPDGSETLEVDITDGTSIFDAAGNASVADQTANNTATLNDEVNPTISSVSLDGSNGFIDVTFSEGVFNTNGGSGALETSDFDLSLTGGSATSPTVTSVTQTGGGGLAGGETTIRVNFSVTGTPDGGETLEVDITDATSIFDAAGNAAAANQTANNTATLNDKLAPSGYTISIDQSPINSGNEGAVSFTFAGAEIGADYSYTVTTSGGAATLTSGGTIATATDQINGVVLSGFQDGTITVSVTLTDTNGNTGIAATDTETKDTVAPTVILVTSTTADGSFMAGDMIAVTVTFSETMTVTGTPQITLETGATDRTVDYTSGTGSSTLTFDYTVQAGDVSTDLDYVATNSLALNSGTINDGAGNAATLTLATPGAAGSLGANKDLVIDTSAPTGYSVGIVQTSINSGNETAMSFAFASAEVGATYNYTLSSTGGGTNVTGSGTIATATDLISSIDVSGLGDGTITLSVTLTDAAGNTGTAATDTETKDTVAPSGYTISIDQSPINSGNEGAVSFTFAGAEIGADYSYTVTTSGGAATLTSGGTIATATDQVTGVVLSGFQDGTITVSVTLEDANGNTGIAATDTETKDTVAPTVTGVTSTTTDGSFMAGDMIAVTVTFSETMTVTGTPQITLETGATDRTVDYTSGTGTSTLTFDYTVQAGDVSTDLDYVATNSLALNSGTINDGAGNAATLTLATPGAAGSLGANKDLVIDTSAPTGYSVGIVQTSINSGNETAMSFAFASAEVGATYNYTLSSTGGGTNVTGSGTIATATDLISSIDVSGLGDGTITLSVTLTDAAGNTGSAATDTETKDTVAPSGYTISIDQSPINSGNEGAVSFTFAGAEIGATYSYSVTTSGGAATLTSGGTIATATDQITGVVLSGFQDGTITVSVTLTDVNSNTGIAATDTETKDTVAPTVTGVTSTTTDGSFMAGDMIAVTVTFSETMTVTGTPQITLETGATDRTVDYTSGTGTSTLTFDYTVQAGDVSTDLDYVATNSLALNSGTINDGAGNAATLTLATPGAAGSLGANKDLVIDTTAPTVTSVSSSTANGSFMASDMIAITVTFSETVTVTGTPQITLETGATDRTANYTSGSGSTTLTFEYTVQAGDVSTDLDYVATNSLALNSGTINDGAGNAATLTLATPGAAGSLGANKDLVIDTTAPTVTSVSSSTANGSFMAGDMIAVTVTFSETVTVTGTPQITLETGATDRLVNYSSGTGSTTLTFDYTVQAGDVNADLDYVATNSLALNSGTINDGTGNAATLTLATPGAAGSLGANKDLVIDTTAPTVTSVSSSTADGSFMAGDMIAVTVTFSETVTVTGTPQITLETGATDRTVNYSSGTGTTTLTFDYTVQAGDVSADLDYVATNSLALNSGTINDGADNAATLTLASPAAAGSLGANKDLVIDTTVPGVTSFTRKTPTAATTNADMVTYLATFNEDVTGVDMNDFTAIGVTGTSIAVSQVTASTYDVTVSGGDMANFNGAMALNFNSPSITDLAGNTLPNTEPATDDLYTLDNTAPTITISTPIEGDGIVETAESSDVEISGTTTGAEDGQTVTVSFNDGTNAAINVNATISSNAWSIAAEDLSGLNDGTITVTADVSDVAGNAATQDSEDITLDQAPPTISLSSPGDDVTNVDIEADITITFNENIQFGSGNIQLIDLDDNSGDITIDASSPGSAASISGAVLTIANPSGFLEESVNYAVQIASTAIQDLGGNAFAGITDNTTFNFTTEAPPTISIGDAAVTEGNSGTADATFTVSLDKTSPKTITIDYATSDNTATTADSDYTAATSTTLTFSPSETSKDVTVAVSGDTRDEDAESFFLDGTNPTNASFADNQGEATITDDDDSPTVAFASATSDGAESVSSADITVEVSTASSKTITVDYAVTGTATGSGTDYTLADGTVTFAADDVSEIITIASIIDDAILEANETVILTLSSPTNATLGTNATHTYTITENDNAAVTIADASLNEADGTVTLTATLDNVVQGGFDVTITSADGTASESDGDYTAVSETLTFAGTAGETQTFTVAVADDDILEANETITLSQGSLSTSAAVDITDEATVTINNDDNATVTIADASGNEDDGDITVTLTLDSQVDGGLTVDVSSADGTATTGDSDYTAVSAETVTFTGTAGETQTVTVASTEDAKVEADETLTISMSNVTATTVATSSITTTDTGTITITNDDAASVTIADVSGAEDAGAITLTATLDNAVDGGFTVDVSTADGTATSADYTSVSDQSLTFSGTAGETQTFTVTPTTDEAVESDETVTVSMGNLASTTFSVTISDEATVTITNDDNAPVITVNQVFEIEGILSAGDEIGTVLATDADAGTTFSAWTIAAGNTDNAFAIAAGTGIITVNDPSVIDLIATPSYSLVMTVSDGTNTSAQETVTIEVGDGIAPTVTLSSDVGAVTNVAPITVTATFSELVLGFALEDLTLTNATASNLVANDAQTTYTFDLTPETEGTVGVSIEAGKATDAVGNLSGASNSVNYFYDTTVPSVSLFSRPSGVTSETSGIVIVQFSEEVSGLEIEELEISSGSLSNLTGSRGTFSVDVSGLSEGTATFTVPADIVNDAAGNGNTEGSISWEVDLTGPSGFTVDILNPAINDLNEDNFRFRINGAEPRSTFNYTINSTGGGSAITGTGELNGNGQGGVLDDIDVSSLGDGTLTLSVEMIDEFGNLGATATDEIQKNTEGESNGIAQGYSPNGDNVDDTWTIPGIEDLPNNSVTIFNRYGTKVWETINYDNEDNSWDSQSNVDNIFGSAGLPDGTYFYVIEFPGTNTDTKSGFVILKR